MRKTHPACPKSDGLLEPGAGVAVLLFPYGAGVATSSTPRPSVSVAQKNTWPRSLFIAPEFGVIKGSGGKTFGPVTKPKIVPTPGMTVPVRATKRSEPSDHTNKPVSRL